MLEKTKCYVLDTSDLVANHEAPFMFGEHRVVVPAICLDELDDLTHRGGHVGTSAQASSRFFDQLREKGNLAEGLPTPGGGIVSVDLNGDTNNRLPRGYDLKKHDHIIINTAIRLQESHPDWRVILVSKDVNMRVKASLKLIAQDFESEKVKPEPPYTGFCEAAMESDLFRAFHTSDAKLVGVPAEELHVDLTNVLPNSCWRFVDNKKDEKKRVRTVLAIYKLGKDGKGYFRLVPKPPSQNSEVKGIYPLNDEQCFALAMAKDNSIDLVTLNGPAGSGKSLLLLLAGYQAVVPQYRKEFNGTVLDHRHISDGVEGCPTKMLVLRPTHEMGESLGFLPGDLSEKLGPWQQATIDNLRLIAHQYGDNLDDLLKRKIIEIDAINFLRGASKHDCFVVIDDAQNFDPRNMKAVVTRIGRNSRALVNGDPGQIDVPTLGPWSNGFIHLVTCFKGDEFYGHLQLFQSVRSRLAAKAAAKL
ncbi:MAG: hypothetical protein A3H57_03105 [Candidatus Taylorbacteria bacterium RIFCSPLOWO2_02_FULL_43_11]|uniref:PIN domain-containing protein n=1 Tax=Candidatus Taylorbacteria bacterium RIFCSPHIGHO2_02_FULL_43_32b TaxID=1802306 RepID=A0A1G2MLM4_9BACT|nr:MAG: hypothetical protein A2743_03200 [Candidatus Taylorbacteria bacterium RIFCSPHIGHO2_01_FULL_43_47]OHA24753.1 MAG: hypothetical protein A3C72_00765 [Candidatus Taylorbacteria bacterium RIFCSPHIGHO2_02_FULL_43_32b]OHA31679.1 MAG: hypothetical protein A3B08_00110 [Candidatus Taylorbacteria bacterium RIFCSPLOWO2_01_FULL_43_44]OHA35392.1 MAG: hypothetical protein A3H57_03105 [Candidatus Taylorbacteria bacterium RIFCSPLOWO2_02_FULL_43_11]